MILILGGSGQLGTAMRARFPDALAPSRQELDLTDVRTLRNRVVALGPGVVINCAAYTDVDSAEDEAELATTVNATAVAELAAAAGQLGVPFVTFSTDYVFDGRAAEPYVESSLPNPVNIYGRSKLEGEQHALRYDRSLVVRTSWLISRTHDNFVAKVVAACRSNVVPVVDDQWGTPTPVDDLVAAVVSALRLRVSGLLHLAAAPVVTRLDLAQAALVAAGMGADRAVGVPSKSLESAAARPAYSALASERTEALGIASLVSWQARLGTIVGGHK